MAGERQARLADRIRVILAERLEKGLRDPRLGFVTITDVRVTGDLQHASVFYTVYGTDEEREASAQALKSATGMLRSEVGKHLNVRLTPSLEFIPDALPENAGHIADLLREAQERDAAVAVHRLDHLARLIGGGLQGGRVLEQHTLPRALADPDGDGGRRGERERMIPFLQPDVVRQVDFATRTITVDWDAEF